MKTTPCQFRQGTAHAPHERILHFLVLFFPLLVPQGPRSIYGQASRSLLQQQHVGWKIPVSLNRSLIKNFIITLFFKLFF